MDLFFVVFFFFCNGFQLNCREIEIINMFASLIDFSFVFFFRYENCVLFEWRLIHRQNIANSTENCIYNKFVVLLRTANIYRTHHILVKFFAIKTHEIQFMVFALVRYVCVCTLKCLFFHFVSCLHILPGNLGEQSPQRPTSGYWNGKEQRERERESRRKKSRKNNISITICTYNILIYV